MIKGGDRSFVSERPADITPQFSIVETQRKAEEDKAVARSPPAPRAAARRCRLRPSELLEESLPRYDKERHYFREERQYFGKKACLSLRLNLPARLDLRLRPRLGLPSRVERRPGLSRRNGCEVSFSRNGPHGKTARKGRLPCLEQCRSSP